MAKSSKQFVNVNSKFMRPKRINFLKKTDQMAKQKKIIEKRRLDIERKLEEEKRKERKQALQRLQDDKPKEADLGKKIFRSSHSRHHSRRRRHSRRRKRERKEDKLPSVMPTNIFPNDGSFLEQFRKLTGIRVLTKTHKLDNETKIEENEVRSENVEDFTSGDIPGEDVPEKEKILYSPTRDCSPSPEILILGLQQMPPQPPMVMPVMVMQSQHPSITNYHQTFNPMQVNLPPPLITSSNPLPAPLNSVTTIGTPPTVTSPSPLLTYFISSPLPIIPHSIPLPLPLNYIPQPMYQPPPQEPQPFPTIFTEQTEVVSSVTTEPPFEAEEIKEATIWDEQKEFFKSDLQDAGMSRAMGSIVSRTEPALLQYAVNAYGKLNLTEDEWKAPEDHYKYEALKQEMPADLPDCKEYKRKEDNIGLQKLSWTEGQGLSSDGSGILDPVNKATVRSDKQGLGVELPDDVSQGDDEYGAYRKKVKFSFTLKPNPMIKLRRSCFEKRRDTSKN